MNQANSIQSMGGTCESITIGHNPFKLPLTKRCIFLKRERPFFLCERMLIETDANEEKRGSLANTVEVQSIFSDDDVTVENSARTTFVESVRTRRTVDNYLDCSIRPKEIKHRSAGALIGAFTNLEQSAPILSPTRRYREDVATLNGVINLAIQKQKTSETSDKLFQLLAHSDSGFLDKK